MLGEAGFKVSPEFLLAASEVMQQQGIFRLELPIQAHLVDACPFDDSINANRARTFTIKQLIHRSENLRLRFSGAMDDAHRCGLWISGGGGLRLAFGGRHDGRLEDYAESLGLVSA
ncbi:hypothetical protein GCM10028811_27090 [Uliginosibacterium sediminicola]